MGREEDVTLLLIGGVKSCQHNETTKIRENQINGVGGEGDEM